MKLAALELQAWNCLASFANWAPDVPQAFEAFGATLGAAFQKRRDLQAPICNMLRRVSTQTRAALVHHAVSDGTGYDALPPKRRRRGSDAASFAGTDFADTAAMEHDGDDSEDEAAAAHDPAIPEGLTLAHAQANVACLRAAASQWLPQLLNTYASCEPQERSGLRDTIAALAPVLGEAAVAGFFKEALAKVVQALRSLQVPLCPCLVCVLACGEPFKCARLAECL